MKEKQYPDLRDHLSNLEKEGLLVRVNRPINKDTEIHPFVRWQFCGGVAEEERKAFLFENVIDSKNKKYDIPVVVGAIASSRQIYSMGVGCKIEELRKKWTEAKSNPIKPVEISSDEAPVHEVVYKDEDIYTGKGVDNLPVPISTPGWDNAPYVSAAHYISKDPDTGIQNVGNYRAHIKGPDRVGMNPSIELRPGIYQHWLKYKERGEPMPAALVIGGVPCVSYASVQKLPFDMDELEVAGGLVGAPLRVVKGKTVDLQLPADSEIVVEGYISTEYLEPEAPFGESHGHINPKEFNAYMEVTAITMREDAHLVSLVSQTAPSESSLMKRTAYEPLYKEHLIETLGIPSVVDVHLHEPLSGVHRVTVIQMEKPSEVETWRALYGAVAFMPSMSKIVIAVDKDIEPSNTDAILWAVGYRSIPHIDTQILKGIDPGHSPRHDERGRADDSAILINAILKGTFPPVALPKKEFMENSWRLWRELSEELGLPKIKPYIPWYGYSLGEWNEELEEEAQLAVQSRYFETGEKIAKQRKSVSEIKMNTSFYGEMSENE